MLKALRVALVAVATLSTALMAGPAVAGMVETPAAKAESNDAGLAYLKHAATEAGVSSAALEGALAKMSEAERAAVTAHVMSVKSAGNLLGIGVAVVAVVIAATIILSEMFWDTSNLTGYSEK